MTKHNIFEYNIVNYGQTPFVSNNITYFRSGFSLSILPNKNSFTYIKFYLTDDTDISNNGPFSRSYVFKTKLSFEWTNLVITYDGKNLLDSISLFINNNKVDYILTQAMSHIIHFSQIIILVILFIIEI